MGGYWALPLGWLNNAILINEFSAPRWGDPYIYDPSVCKTFALSTWAGCAVACGSCLSKKPAMLHASWAPMARCLKIPATGQRQDTSG